MKALLLSLLLLVGDGFTEGQRAYQEGRFREAYEAFHAQQREAGEEASAELLYNLALAAVRAGALREAEIAAEKAAARGGPEFTARRDFLRGNIAFTRCERATVVAVKPDVQPHEFVPALKHARTALESWQQAAVSRPDWPEARRNVQRALHQLQDLLQKQKAAESNRKEDKPPPEPPPPEPQPLLDKLKEKDQQKRELRRRKLPRIKVEKDW